MVWLSPNIDSSTLGTPPSLDEKINVFEDRVQGWQIGIARQVEQQIQHSGYAVLSIVLSYYEMIGKCRNGHAGTDKAGHYFREGFKDVHPATGANATVASDVLNDFYKKTRCGMYHVGMTKTGVFLTGDPPAALSYDSSKKVLFINPHLLVPELARHFAGFVAEIRNTANAQLRSNFENWFDSF